MKATLTFEGKTVEVEIAEDEARKIFGEPKTGWERVEKGACYYTLLNVSGLTVANRKEMEVRADIATYNQGIYFSDSDLANDQARAISLWLRIKRWAAEHCEPVDWSDEEEEKFYIHFNNLVGSFEVGNCRYLRQSFCIYFDTQTHANQCIEEFRDELTWYFTKCRDRMDG